MEQKKYDGTVYVGVVGSEMENGECRDSINAILLRNGDSLPFFVRATKGYEARQSHLNKFMENKQFSFLLLLDHDMIFPADTLERLRSHGLPFISGYYLRRRYAPMLPIWFEPGDINDPWKNWWTSVPEPNTLYHLGASGWGCMLIHRDVIEATRPLLKGEPEIIEDDMDVYPYDLEKVMDAVRGIKALAENYPKREVAKPAIQAYAKTLTEEIKPLTGRKNDITGSDVRFPFYARLAGFDLYGDSGVECQHSVIYPLKPSDYRESMTPEQIENFNSELHAQSDVQRVKIREQLDKLNGVEHA